MKSLWFGSPAAPAAGFSFFAERGRQLRGLGFAPSIILSGLAIGRGSGRRVSSQVPELLGDFEQPKSLLGMDDSRRYRQTFHGPLIVVISVCCDPVHMPPMSFDLSETTDLARGSGERFA